ncbi:MAG: hypothetical protein H0V89_13735 [Deltaproteobacteria bacterium]|nr:hypothetical protein [Deltaproteobacteria bacterium]
MSGAAPVVVSPIELPRDAKAWMRSWWPLYADDPHWVPPLFVDKMNFLNPAKNPYFKHADVRCFQATCAGRIVGTIAATHDHELAKHEPGIGLFGFFEFENDPSVARALLEAARAYLAGFGLHTLRGPFNFNSNHDFGLLVDGFDTDPMIANPHNRAYYPEVYERIGLAKAMDWYAYWLDKGPMPQTVLAISERFLKRNPEVTLRQLDPKNFASEVALFRDIYNDAWEQNYGHVYLHDEEFAFAAQGFKQILDPRLCWFAYVGDECAAAAITLPDFNQVVKRVNGSLFPLGWWPLASAMMGWTTPDAIRVFVLGVKKKFQHMPLGAPLYINTWKSGMTMPIRGAEASLILETNVKMRGAMEKLGGRIYKTYRTYEAPVAV